MEENDLKNDTFFKNIMQNCGWDNAPDDFTQQVLKKLDTDKTTAPAELAGKKASWEKMNEFTVLGIVLGVMFIFVIIPFYDKAIPLLQQILNGFLPLVKIFSNPIILITIAALVVIIAFERIYTRKIHY